MHGESQLRDKHDSDPARHRAAVTIEPGETPALEQLPVFDRDALLELLDGDLELMGQILEHYLACVDGYLDLLSAALYSFDVTQVRIKAHLVKGAAVNIGALRVSEAARQLEMLAREGGLGGAAVLFDRLLSAVVDFRAQAGLAKQCAATG